MPLDEVHLRLESGRIVCSCDREHGGAPREGKHAALAARSLPAHCLLAARSLLRATRACSIDLISEPSTICGGPMSDSRPP